MKFHWKLLLAFYLPLHFAFGSFYVAGLLQSPNGYGEGGFSFHDDYFHGLTLYHWFEIVGFGLIFLSIFLPSLLLYRKYQAQPAKLFD